jgi:hypothetical protein
MKDRKNSKRFGKKVLAAVCTVMMLTVALAPNAAMADSSNGGGR